MLYSDEMLHVLRAKGFDVKPGDTLTDEMREELAPGNWATPEAYQQREALVRKAQLRNVWLADFSDPSIIGLAKAMKDSKLTGEALWQKLREQIYKGVMLHEIGHTVGLRHNFGASSDALNFFPEYWQARKITGLPANDTGVTFDSSQQDFSRVLNSALAGNCEVDLINGGGSAACEQQRNMRMAEFQSSSIMDYGAKFNSDFAGLGKYDVAALGSAYANVVQVFDPSVADNLSSGFVFNGGVQAGQQRQLTPFKDFAVSVSTQTNPLYGGLGEQIHYTHLPSLMGNGDVEAGIANLEKRKWISRTEFENTKCDAENMNAGCAMRVPYVACYDEYRDATPLCHTWDEGADAFEINRNFVNSYKQYYVFNNFARDRVGYSPWDTLNRSLGRYFLPILNMYQHWLYNQGFSGLGDLSTSYLSRIAMFEGFATLANVMTTPSYGTYVERDGEYLLTDLDDTGEGVYIQPGPGRRLYTRYDYESGYELFSRVLESGHFYEQLAAQIALVQSNASIVGVGQDVSADGVSFSIPFSIVFGDDLSRLFGGIATGITDAIRPKINDGQYQPLHWTTYSALRFGEEDQLAGMPIDIRYASNTPIYAALYGAAMVDPIFQTSFVERMHVTLEGDGNDTTVHPNFEEVRFANPVSGRVYIAYKPAADTGADNLTTDQWFAADLVARGRDLAALYSSGSGNQDQISRQLSIIASDLEMLRSLYEIFGKDNFFN